MGDGGSLLFRVAGLKDERTFHPRVAPAVENKGIFMASHLKEMNEKLKRLRKRQKSLQAAIQEIRDQFQAGERAEFDPGDMKLIGCTVVATTDEHVIVQPDVVFDYLPWPMHAGRVYVPFACIFTQEAAAEMHKVRDPILDQLSTK